MSPISCWHVARLSRQSVRLINEGQNLHHSQSKVVSRNFFGWWLSKRWKKSVSLTDSDDQTPRRGRKPKYAKKKPKVTNSVALVMAFPSAVKETRRKEDLPQADFSDVPESCLLLVRTKSMTENFVYWKLRPPFVFVMLLLFLPFLL